MSMAPILFSDAATNYSTQGIGSLADALSCYVTEELNGQYELQMTYPVTGRRFKDIKNRCLIYCKPDPYRAGQPFRIYRITKPLNGVVTIYAQHISYDLAGIPVRGFSASSLSGALAGLVSNAIIENPFTFWTDISSDTDFSVSAPSKCRSLLGGSEGSILDTYGGEYEWDIMTVRLRSHRGQNNGVRIAYGKNLTDISQDENISNLVTGIVGYWTSSDGTVVVGPVVNAQGTYNFSRVTPVDFSSDFEEQPTPEQLEEISQQYITKNGIGVPDVSINVSWVQLEQYSGHEGLSLLERVSLGDTVTVEFPDLGVDATARVVKTKYDALRNRYESADIGSIQANIADTIANQQRQIDETPDVSTVQQIANSITQAILGAKGGSVRLLDTNGDGDPDTLYIADNPDPAQAVKVWRFNYEGWGASSNGYNGPFEMSAALGLGMYADFITVGTLTAVRIQSADGRCSWDLASGGNAIFNANSIIINSSNFQLDAQGNVTASGTFTSNNGVVGTGRNVSQLSSGGLYLTRTISNGSNANAAALYGYGSNASFGYLILYGTLSNGSQGQMVTVFGDYDGSHMSMRDGNGNAEITFNGGTGAAVFAGNVDVQGPIGLGVTTTVNCQNLTAWGSKSRVVPTSAGAVKMAAMESPEPIFADSGSAQLDGDGLCLINLHPVFAETLDRVKSLRWLITPTAEGTAWVEKRNGCAMVHGTPGLTFDWMCIGAQRGYADVYAERCYENPPRDRPSANDLLDWADLEDASNRREAESMLDAYDWDGFMDSLFQTEKGANNEN